MNNKFGIGDLVRIYDIKPPKRISYPLCNGRYQVENPEDKEHTLICPYHDKNGIIKIKREQKVIALQSQFYRVVDIYSYQDPIIGKTKIKYFIVPSNYNSRIKSFIKSESKKYDINVILEIFELMKSMRVIPEEQIVLIKKGENYNEI